MTKRITTVTDLVQWVDDWCQDSQDRDGETHAQVIERTGRQLWNEGHIDGLRSGDDWSEWLGRIDLDAISKFIDRETSQITPDDEALA